MKKFSIMIALLLIILMLSGCKSSKQLIVAYISPGDNSSKQLLNDKIKADDVDTVQIVLAMGNPEYGANSKIITDKAEINKIVDIFNSAYIGEEVNGGDIHVTAGSSYYFFGGDNTLYQFTFNGNDTERIWLNSKCYYVTYTDSTPYDMYRDSSANEIVVDEKLAEMERPQ